MENASKALIIAGAILLSILIISLGLMVFNNARDSVNSNNLDEQQIEAYNSKFEAFLGERVSGSQVNALISKAIASNQADANEENGIKIKINSLDPTSASRAKTNKYYTVTVSKYNQGLISDITVTEYSSSSSSSTP